MMKRRNEGGDFSLDGPYQNDNNDQLAKLPEDIKKIEAGGNYDGICTNDAPKPGDPQPEGNNEHKSRDCNLCARLCYLSIQVVQFQDVYCTGLTAEEVSKKEQNKEELIEQTKDP